MSGPDDLRPGVRPGAEFVMKRIIILVASLGALLLMPQPTSASAQVQVQRATPAVPTYQIIGAAKLNALVAGGLPQATANYLFNIPKAFIAVGANGDPASLALSDAAKVRAGYPNATGTWLFNSYGPNWLTKNPGILGTFGPGGAYGPGKPNPANLAAVMYDPEGQASNGTPQAECDALEAGNLGTLKAAIALVHAKGLKFLFTPSADVGMLGSEGGFPNKYITWLRQNRGAWAAAGEDYYSIQSQQAEGTSIFVPFIQFAMALAHAAAPNVVTFIGIGINPHVPPTVITTRILRDAYRTGLAFGAGGFWQNVQRHTGANVSVSVYVHFLERL